MTEIDPNELLSALLDREPVDADALAAMLEDPASRALLVDFVRLRSALHADDGSVGAPRPQVAPRRRAFSSPLFQIAAALVLVVLGALAGRRLATSDPDAPPEPTRVVQLAPSTGAGGPR